VDRQYGSSISALPTVVKRCAFEKRKMLSMRLPRSPSPIKQGTNIAKNLLLFTRVIPIDSAGAAWCPEATNVKTKDFRLREMKRWTMHYHPTLYQLATCCSGLHPPKPDCLPGGRVVLFRRYYATRCVVPPVQGSSHLTRLAVVVQRHFGPPGTLTRTVTTTGDQ
jgi:hypothetical protein